MASPVAATTLRNNSFPACFGEMDFNFAYLLVLSKCDLSFSKLSGTAIQSAARFAALPQLNFTSGARVMPKYVCVLSIPPLKKL